MGKKETSFAKAEIIQQELNLELVFNIEYNLHCWWT